MYAKFSSIMTPQLMETNEGTVANEWTAMHHKLKQYHHVRLDREFKEDCHVWCQFLSTSSGIGCCPFLDLHALESADTLDFYSDAAKGVNLGFGAVFEHRWLFGQWEPGFITTCDPSIEYLELFGVCAAIFAWSSHLQNRRIVLFYDNQSVVAMLNNSTSSCKNCIILIRLLTLRSLIFNFRVFCRWVKGSCNARSDLFSRQKVHKFKQLTQTGRRDVLPTELQVELWPLSKLWIN